MSQAAFVLHPQLAADAHLVEDWPLSRVLLMNDRRFPWLILVPRRALVVELHELAPADRAMLVEEIARASQALAKIPPPGKINVAALGNVVRQLHVHVVVRRPDDAAQPGLVWGSGTAQPYGDAERRKVVSKLRSALRGGGST